jgi:hypothetical protein
MSLHARLLVSTALCVCAVVVGGCGGSSKASSDAGVATDAATDSAAELPHNGTSGMACATDAECDPQKLGTSVCSASKPLYTNGSFDPFGMCVDESACSIPDPTLIAACDKNTGMCVPTAKSNVCVPACAFDDSGATPTGCSATGNVCNPAGWGKDGSGRLSGIGYCLGGCTADGDCKVAGEKCDLMTELCTKAAVIKAPTKALGASCSQADGTAQICNCYYSNTAPTAGVCSQNCRVGDTKNPCPTGFSCDPTLAPTLSDGSAGFTTLPVGMGGYCLRNCTADTDCASGVRCLQSGGIATKTCQLPPS